VVEGRGIVEPEVAEEASTVAVGSPGAR
jgi:hypothetical protein